MAVKFSFLSPHFQTFFSNLSKAGVITTEKCQICILAAAWAALVNGVSCDFEWIWRKNTKSEKYWQNTISVSFLCCCHQKSRRMRLLFSILAPFTWKLKLKIQNQRSRSMKTSSLKRARGLWFSGAVWGTRCPRRRGSFTPWWQLHSSTLNSAGGAVFIKSVGKALILSTQWQTS